jgi:predicted GNAT superfamily acetyltransferase
MGLEIRELGTPEELEEVVRLQMEVGGLPERHVTSPTTLKVMTLEYPRVGWVLGAFEDGRMVGFTTAFATREPDTVLGFMLAVDPACQNQGAGRLLLQREWEMHRSHGVKRVCWTYEPLEARNAHLYLNKMGARGVGYVENYYYLDTGLHAGLPQDRLLVEARLDQEHGGGAPPLPLEEALERWPVARAGQLPEADEVLAEIPLRVHELLDADPQAARAARLETRAVLGHYLNGRGYAAVALHRGEGPEGPRALYRLARS